MTSDKYTVVESRQIQSLSPTGASREAYRVWLRTEKGATGSIDVEPEDWTAEKLKPVLDQFAERLDLAFSITQ